MILSRHTISIALVLIFVLSLYLLIALPLLQESATPPPEAAIDAARDANPAIQPVLPDTPGTETIQNAETVDLPPAGASQLLEIYGRVTDSLGEPIEDVLVTEERYFFSTRSDASGNYRLLLDLPRHRLPILSFLRAGYNAKRINPKREEIERRPLYELDVVLEDSVDTLRLTGWVANDLGVALEGARVDISALDTTADEDFYLTVFSDQQGNFILEGVRSETRYKLSVNLAPDYPVYHDPDFHVGVDPQHLDIRLKSLSFVDLSGMIMNPESAPVADFEIHIKNVTSGLHTRKIVSDSSGFFSLPNFPLGEVSLVTRGSEFFKISGLELSEKDYSNLVLVVDKGDRYLTGWVHDEDGIAIEKAMVTLDAIMVDDGVESFSYRSTSTDSNGRFSFDGIAGGDHRISVYANGFNKLDVQHQFINQSEQVHLTMTRHY